MRITEKRKNILKITAMTSMAIFALFSVFSGTAAWFGMNQKITQNNDNMEVHSPERHFKKISFHKVVQIDYDNGIFYFDQNPISEATQAQVIGGTASLGFEMDHYTLLRKQNPLLALVELNEAYEVTAQFPINATLFTDSTQFLTSYDAATVEAMTNKPLSNIIRFSSGYLTCDPNGDGVGDSLSDHSQTGSMNYAIDPQVVSSAQYVFDEPNNYDSFWALNNQGVPVLTPDKNLFTGQIGQKVQYVYVIFDYHLTMLEVIYNHFLGRSFLEDDLLFRCDWTLKV